MPANGHPSPEVWVVRAGVVPYAEARVAQKRLEAARVAGELPDILLLLEHPPVYTRGRRSTLDELPMGEDWYRSQGIEVRDTDRGGRVTYHGPGQLVGYPIVSLKPYLDDVHEYIRRLERTVIAALADWRIEAGPIPGLTGVWTKAASSRAPRLNGRGLPAREAKKIGSIGVHVSRGVTTHGFAINVNNDLEPFEWIVPCGIESCTMTSVSNELGAEGDLFAFATAVRDRFGEVYGRLPIEVDAGELGECFPAAREHAGLAPSLP
jgi:lipoyl(octanoyl) transferase